MTGILTWVFAWNEYLFAATLTSVHARTITTGLAEFVTEWSMMMAFSVLASAPLVVAFIFLQRYMVRGMTAGAIRRIFLVQGLVIGAVGTLGGLLLGLATSVALDTGRA